MAETDPDMFTFALDDISLWFLKAKANGDQDIVFQAETESQIP